MNIAKSPEGCDLVLSKWTVGIHVHTWLSRVWAPYYPDPACIQTSICVKSGLASKFPSVLPRTSHSTTRYSPHPFAGHKALLLSLIWAKGRSLKRGTETGGKGSSVGIPASQEEVWSSLLTALPVLLTCSSYQSCALCGEVYHPAQKILTVAQTSMRLSKSKALAQE